MAANGEDSGAQRQAEYERSLSTHNLAGGRRKLQGSENSAATDYSDARFEQYGAPSFGYVVVQVSFEIYGEMPFSQALDLDFTAHHIGLALQRKLWDRDGMTAMDNLLRIPELEKMAMLFTTASPTTGYSHSDRSDREFEEKVTGYLKKCLKSL